MPLNIKSSSLIRKTNSPTKKPEAAAGAVTNSPSTDKTGAQKSPSNLASGLRSRQPLSRGSTDSTTPTLARKPSQASIISTVSKADKKRSAWRGVAKTLPGLLKSSKGASSTSLISQEPEPVVDAALLDSPQLGTSPDSKSKIPVRRTTLSPKISTLADLRAASPPNAGHAEGALNLTQRRDSDERTEFSDGSGTMVEDTQATVRLLSEELSTTQQQLTETKNECAALHEHVRTLESAHNTQLRQSVEEAVNHTKVELLRAHSLALDEQKETVRSLQKRNEELASRVMLAEDQKADSIRAHTSETQSLQSHLRTLQQSIETLQHEVQIKDDHVGRLNRENSELSSRVTHLEEDGRVLVEGGAEAQKMLLNDIGRYRHQLEEAQKALAERDLQVTQLQTSKKESEGLLICAQSSLDEKDKIIGDLQRRNAVVVEQNGLLEGRLRELEGGISETKNSIHEYERRLADAEKVTQDLRSELSSSTSVAQQLRVALDASRADTQTVLASSEEHASQLRQARELYVTLQENVRALEEEKKILQAEKTELVRAHSAEIEAERRAVHNLRRSIESSQRESSSKQERSSLLALANEELRREVNNLTEERQRKEEETTRTRKELEVVNAELSASEEKIRIALESAKEEKEKLAGEITRLYRQLQDAQNQLATSSTSSQTQESGEKKSNSDLQKALTTIEEQKVVIGRLQQSVGEQSKEERRPSLFSSVMKGSTSRERPRSSPTSPSIPAKPSPSRRTTISSEVPLQKASTSKTSPTLPSGEGSKMLKDQERAFQAGSTDSLSEGSQTGTRRQVEDLKRLRQQTEAGLVYRMGHAVFGSLWRRVWG